MIQFFTTLVNFIYSLPFIVVILWLSCLILICFAYYTDKYFLENINKFRFFTFYAFLIAFYTFWICYLYFGENYWQPHCRYSGAILILTINLCYTCLVNSAYAKASSVLQAKKTPFFNVSPIFWKFVNILGKTLCYILLNFFVFQYFLVISGNLSEEALFPFFVGTLGLLFLGFGVFVWWLSSNNREAVALYTRKNPKKGYSLPITHRKLIYFFSHTKLKLYQTCWLIPVGLLTIFVKSSTFAYVFIGLSFRFDQGLSINLLFFVTLCVSYISFLSSFRAYIKKNYGNSSLRLLGLNVWSQLGSGLGAKVGTLAGVCIGCGALDVVVSSATRTYKNDAGRVEHDKAVQDYQKQLEKDPATAVNPGQFTPAPYESVMANTGKTVRHVLFGDDTKSSDKQTPGKAAIERFNSKSRKF